MTNRNWRLRSHVRCVLAASALTLGAYAHPTFAQTPPADNSSATTELETVVVTGSLIRGAATDAALPVDVVSSQELEERGSPSIVELVKTISASTAAIGESNRYNVGAGTAGINLRGFGQAR